MLEAAVVRMTADFAPGIFACPKCGFRLISSNLNMGSGTVTAATDCEDDCGNCGIPLTRVTWKEEAHDAYKTAESQFERAMEAEKKLAAIVSAIEPVRDWYDGEPADGDVHVPRELADIITDIVSDLQSDRDGALKMHAALQPFAACMEYIKDDEDDEEWAKFRLIIRNYRDAQAARDSYGADPK